MLYRRAMGADFDALPPALQRFHSVAHSQLYEGEVTVSHGGALARRIAAAGGMPGRTGTMPFRFRASSIGAEEIWERDFDGHLTRSRQWLHAPGIVVDKVGPFGFLMAPRPRDGGLNLPIVGLRAFGLPLPRGVLGSCEGVEGVTADGAVTFDVHASAPGLGLIIRYRGVLRGPVGGA